MKKPVLTVRRLVIAALLGALTIVMSFTVGYIPIAGSTVTVIHLPTIIAALLEGPVVGGFVGLIFGVFSLIRALVAPVSPTDIFFLDPLVSVLPRVLLGLITYGVMVLVKRMFARGPEALGRSVSWGVGAAVGTVCHTVMVLGLLGLLHGSQVAEALSIQPAAVTGLLVTVGASSALMEGIAAVVASVAIAGAVMVSRQRGRK